MSAAPFWTEINSWPFAPGHDGARRAAGNLLVATAMSNLALEIFMREHGGSLLRTKVGDRYVVEAMRREGAMLGGEQSGHLIFRQYSTTGDGLLAALANPADYAREGKTAFRAGRFAYALSPEACQRTRGKAPSF